MCKKSFSLQELAIHTQTQPLGSLAVRISGVNTLEEAGLDDASFLANPRYKEAMKKSKAAILCVDPSVEIEEGKNYLISSSPSLTFQMIAALLFPQSSSAFQGIHSTAVIHETAQIEEGVSIGPYAVIDRNVKIKKGTWIGPHVYIGFDVEIGEHCYLHPGAIVREGCLLKNHVILQPGAVIGSCGFGFILTPQGTYQKLEQMGNVVLEDHVEIGANTTVDRSRFKTTWIRRGSKIDNLCQIAHNVDVGEHNVIAAQTGIAGSSKTGHHVMMGGQVGVVGHVKIEDQVMIATRGGVSKSLKRGQYRGSPVMPLQEYQRNEIHLRKMEEYVQKLKNLEQRLSVLEQKKESV